ncbi:MAG: prolyl oligopeptidase family serine peptidase [Dermabacter sp.]|nr:prolyl oligopeptidase family serine peptidase [Dermabacter sp.]
MTSTTPASPALPAPDGSTDPHQWLEEVEGEKQLAWVRERNAVAEADLDADPLTAELEREILDILDAKDKIPGVTKRGDYLYNFWTDADHERGVWRRTTMEEFRREDPAWEVLIDVDALNAAEGEDWVWHGASALRPADGVSYRHFLIDLSHGGADADVTREWDLETRAFVPAEDGGFYRPEAKGSVSWIDADTVWVSTEVGEDSMTTSGYPRQVRLWRRGQELAATPVVAEAKSDDMGAFIYHDQTPGFERSILQVMHTFYTSTTSLVQVPLEAPEVVALELPEDMQVAAARDLLVLEPRSDWSVEGREYAAGSLLVGGIDAFLAGDRAFDVLFEPTASSSLAGMAITKSCLVLTILEDVRHRLEVFTRDSDGAWVRAELYPELAGAVSVSAVDPVESDEVWVSVTDFATPTTLLLGDLSGVADGDAPGELHEIKATPERFDADGVQVSQHFAVSDDGTRVPYFQIARAVEPGSPDEGEPRPTLLYGYGGFEISLTPAYLGAIGKAWVERGGVYVVANIRGGGEYGPAWHQAGLKEKRHRVYEDFSSVAKDLIERGVTDAAHLGVRGGSNGGLLTGNMLVSYPELFGAVIIQVPLLDMKRFSHLLAGASWMAEYGDPDTADWEFIRTFSPYHLLKEGAQYPPTFVLTSTRDDRVHPGHARKFTAALESLGARVLSWENIEGGHGGAASNAQAARMNALIYSFLWQQLGRES